MKTLDAERLRKFLAGLSETQWELCRDNMDDPNTAEEWAEFVACVDQLQQLITHAAKKQAGARRRR